MARIAEAFSSARSEGEAGLVAKQAIAFYTRNSGRINAPLRNGDRSTILHQMCRAIDYGLERLPDYGRPSGELHRLVDLPRETIDAIVQSGHLTDPAFISTSAMPLAVNGLSMRNTLIHIRDARFAADVSHISPDPHARETLLRSSSTLTLLKSSITPVDDEDDPLFNPDRAAFRAELWMTQAPHEANAA